MAAGKKLNYAREVDSGSFMDKYALTLAVASDLINVSAKASVDDDGVIREVIECDYIGSGAIDLTDYANLPIYSKIWDHQANKYHVKKAASGTSTWVSSAAAS